MILYCATTNPGKVAEFRLAGSGNLVIEPLPGMCDISVCEETGRTFEENAVQKALYYGNHQEWVFAEDSGLEVDALGGAPGVYSARFSGPDATDASNNRLLLDRLAVKTERTGRYVCVIALAHAGKLVKTFRGTVEGEILLESRGTNGFGYDPLFYYPPFGGTFGEVSASQKQTVSHRGAALQQLVAYLKSETL